MKKAARRSIYSVQAQKQVMELQKQLEAEEQKGQGKNNEFEGRNYWSNLVTI